jgi:hypothetical protein
MFSGTVVTAEEALGPIANNNIAINEIVRILLFI